MRVLFPLLFVALAACSFGGGGQGEKGEKGWQGKSGKPMAEPVTLVLIDEVGLGEVADTLSSTAIVESEASADLIPISAGVVLSLHKDEGDPVHKGDLLAVLDNVSLDAGAERAQAEVTRLQQQYDELAELAARGAVSDRELSDVAYQLQTARTSAREASRSFGQTRLTAPFDGVVAARDVRVGELAGSGTAAFKIVDLDRLRVITSLPERDLPRVEVGQPARLVSAYNTDNWASGEIVRIAPIIDATSGTFRVTIGLDDGQNALRPGQFVSVDLEVDRRRDVVVVPRMAVVYEDGFPVVYRYIPMPEPSEDEAAATAAWGGDGDTPWWKFWASEEDDEEEVEEAVDPHVAERISVQLGLVDDDFAEVLEGVAVGDRVITVGQSHLRDGARVKISDEEIDNAEAESADAAEDQG